MRAHLSITFLLAACGGGATTTKPTTPGLDEPPPEGDVEPDEVAALTAQLEAAEDPAEKARLHAELGALLWEQSCPDAVFGLCIAKTEVTLAPRTTCASYQLESVTSNIEPVARDEAKAAAAIEHFEAALEGGDPAQRGAARLALIDRDFETAFGHPFPRDLDFQKDKKGSTQRFNDWFGGTVKRLEKANIAYRDLGADAELAAVDPSYKLAGAYRRGSLTQWFADQLFRAPVPADLQADEDLHQTYCDALFDKAEPLEASALAMFKACVADADKAGYTGVWRDQCQLELEALDPTLKKDD